jgi:hypothetical protein
VNVLIDNCLSPKLARSLSELFKGQHTVEHLRHKFGEGVADIDWIDALSKDGRWVVISGDRRITKVKAEHAALRSSRLIGFFLSKGLYKATIVRQMERILALWSGIEALSATVQGGAMFELPGTSSRIKQLKD